MLTEVTTIRLSPLSKAEMEELASRLKINRSELIRVLVHEALAILQEREAQEAGEQKRHVPNTMKGKTIN